MIQDFNKSLLKNISSLYFVQSLNFVFPLITLPFLARTLGVSEYGKLLLAQSIALYGSALIEYGFSLSATRKLARARDSRDGIDAIVANTLNAKYILSVLVTIFMISIHSIGGLNIIGEYVVGTTLLAVVSGWNFQWYFRGADKMKFIVLLDTLNKFLVTASIFVFIHRQHDGPMVLMLQVLFLSITTGLGFLVLRRNTSSLPFNIREGLRTIVREKDLFFFSNMAVLHSNAPVIFVSSFAGTHVLGIFAGAFKLTKQLILLLSAPLWDAVFPYLSHSLKPETDVFQQNKILRILTINVMSGSLIGMVMFLKAEFIMEAFFGSEFRDGISALKILAVACPLYILNVSVLNIFISQGKNSIVNTATLTNIIIVISVLLYFSNGLNAVDAAVSVVISEAVLLSQLVALFIISQRKNDQYIEKHR